MRNGSSQFLEKVTILNIGIRKNINTPILKLYAQRCIKGCCCIILHIKHCKAATLKHKQHMHMCTPPFLCVNLYSMKIYKLCIPLILSSLSCTSLSLSFFIYASCVLPYTKAVLSNIWVLVLQCYDKASQYSQQNWYSHQHTITFMGFKCLHM